MQINKEADFVLKSNKVVHPPVRTDGLELYYDTKGKKNTDTYKNKLLDMSGNDRHGELQNFNYKNLSGYQEDSQLVFDGIDDKLVLGDVEKPEIISATKNLFDGTISNQILTLDSSGNMLIIDHRSSKSIVCKIEGGKKYTLSKSGGDRNLWGIFDKYPESGNRATLNGSGVSTETAPIGSEYIVWYVATDESQLPTSIQVEEGSTATPYVPYIPSIRGTYQLNNNIISYDRDTVKWVKDEEVVERKGINLVRNGNFWNSTENWMTSGYHAGINISNGTATNTSNGTSNRSIITTNYINIPAGHKVYINVDARFQAPEKINNFRILRGLLGAQGQDIFQDIQNRDFNNYISVGEWGEGKNLRFLTNLHSDLVSEGDWIMQIKNVQLIDLTATFGAGNEPTLEEIQAEPDKWQWLPNPLDLVEAKELKGNILGDMEDIIDDHTRDEQSGIEVFTDKADDSLVRVEVDGRSVGGGSGKNTIEAYGVYLGGNVVKNKLNGITASDGVYRTNGHPRDLIGFIAKARTGSITISGRTGLSRVNYYYSLRNVNGETVQGQTSSNVPVTDGFFKITLNIPNIGSEYIYIGIGQFPYVDDYTIYNIQIEEGAIPTEYELPAPTPNYPIEIHSLNDFDVVSSVGRRNLFAHDKVKLQSVNIRKDSTREVFIHVGNNHNTSIFRMDSLGLDIGKIYTISFDIKALNDSLQFSGSPVYINSVVNGIGFSQPRLRKDEWVRVYIDPFNYHTENEANLHIYFTSFNTGGQFELRNFKVEEVKHSPYYPAPEDITESDNHPLIDKINLSLSEPLRSVGDVKDRLFRDDSDGLWKIERNVAEVAINNSSRWNHHAQSNTEKDSYETRLVTTIVGHSRQIVSDRFIGTLNQNAPINNIRMSSSGYLNFAVGKGKINNLSEWFSQNPFTILYEEVPSIETLDQETQDKLNNLRSFQDSNYVYTVIMNETDSFPSYISENLKPQIHTEFLAKDHFKESRTVNNLLIWNRSLEDEELLNQNKLFHERFNMRSNTAKGEPINQEINLLNGGYVGNTLSLDYTLEI